MMKDIEEIRKKYPTKLTRGRAIKLYCKEQCCSGDTDNWKNCTVKGCFLWSFRRGKEIIPSKGKSTKKSIVLPSKSTKNSILQDRLIVSEVKDETSKD
jgi:hypothetical protein